MTQITLYLDEATSAMVDAGAEASGMSKSRWVADAIRNHVAHPWPSDCLALAGRFADFPLRADACAAVVEDTPRVRL